jgi:hypothetical protein
VKKRRYQYEKCHTIPKVLGILTVLPPCKIFYESDEFMATCVVAIKVCWAVSNPTPMIKDILSRSESLCFWEVDLVANTLTVGVSLLHEVCKNGVQIVMPAAHK